MHNLVDSCSPDAYNSSIMSKLQAKEKYVLTFGKNDDGEDIRNSFLISLSIPLGEKIRDQAVGELLVKFLSELGGLDQFDRVGMYTARVLVAATFDADEFVAALRAGIEAEVLSEIVRPQIVT